MAYTNVWSDTTPTGSEAANTIDDIFRGLKVDIEQRLMDIFGSMPSFTIDPLRLYGLKFTDAQDSIINLGDNSGTPRLLIVKDKASSNTYLSLSSLGLSITGTLAASGNFAINTNKFSIAASSGNTLVAGTLGITGILNASSISASADINTVAAASIFWNTRTILKSPADGQLTLLNSTASGFDLLQLGGTTSSFPGFQRNGVGILTRLADNSANTTLTASRLFAGTDIATSVAYAVFGDATALEPTWGFTPIANVLGIVSSVTNDQATGTYLHGHIQTKQTVATTGTIQGLETWTWASHTSGTVVGVFGLLGNCAVSGVGGTTTNVVCLTGGVVVSGGTVTQVKGVNSGSTVDGASSVVTNMYGLYSKAPIVSNSGTITNNYGLYIENMNAGTTINYAIKTNGGKVNFLSLPTSSAGLSTGDVWSNAGVLTIV